MRKRLLVYVAGPYSPQEEGDIDSQMRQVEENVRRAVHTAEEVILRGHVPIIPHTHTQGYALRTNLPQTSDLYYYWDREILRRCDAILRYGHSFGADREWKWGHEFGLLCVEGANELPEGPPPLVLRPKREDGGVG